MITQNKKETMENLLRILTEFHEFQIEQAVDGKPPYEYSTLGLAGWLEFDKGVKL